jgi:hypothetical protein
MAETKEAPKTGAADSKPKQGMDYNAIAKKLKEHAEGLHIDDITERISKTYMKHKESVGNKRKLTTEQAETLGHQMYDELLDYIATAYYGVKPEELKKMKGLKGKHGNSMLDSIVEHEFKLSRADLVKNLKKNADAGKYFSAKYMQQLLEENVGHYNEHVQGLIIRDLNEEHMDDLKKQIQGYIANHKLDEEKFKGALKSKNFREILGTYASLASNYYKEPPAPKKA